MVRHFLLEELEDRSVPAVVGGAWPDLTHLTVSFAPDGTAIGSSTSQLFATLDAQMSRAVWQGEILNAIEAWANVANANVTVVSDDGSALGNSTAVQGNGAYGDIRIAATSLGAGEVAVATPVATQAGSWSGSILLNSDYLFSNTGAGNTYDLNTIVMHEAGHVFGMADSTDPTSVMFANYIGKRAGLGAVDVQNAQALYQQQANNHTQGTATALASEAGTQPGAPAYLAYGNLGTAGTKDYYSFQAGMTGTNFSAVLQLADPTQAASLTLLDSTGTAIATTVTSNGAGSYTLSATGLSAGATYYLSVAGTNASAAVGTYSLSAQFAFATSVQAPVMSGILSAMNPQSFEGVTLGAASLMNFNMTVTGPANSAIEMQIYDANGNVVSSQTVQAGSTANFNAFLGAGTWNVRFFGGNAAGSPLGLMTFSVTANVLTDPIGPRLKDPSAPLPPANLNPQWLPNALDVLRSLYDPYGRPYGTNTLPQIPATPQQMPQTPTGP
jgi:hypothetical protein